MSPINIIQNYPLRLAQFTRYKKTLESIITRDYLTSEQDDIIV